MKLLSSYTSTTNTAAAIAILSLVLILGLENSSVFVAARKPPSRTSATSARSSNARLPSSSSSSRRAPVSSRQKKRTLVENNDDVEEEDDVEFDTFDDEDDMKVPSVLEEEDEEADDDAVDDDIEGDDDEFSEPPPPKSRRPSSKQPPSRTSRNSVGSGPPVRSSRRGPAPSSASRYEEEEEFEEDSYEEEEDYPRPSSRRQPPRSSSSNRGSRGGPPPPGSRQQPPPRRGSGPPPRSVGGGRNPPRRSGSVVPYSSQQGPTAFTRGLEVLKNTIPDPAAIREAAANSLKTARETTSSLSANLYREVKGLTSSELEQVMLKATKPDDTPVKGKHVERLVGVTYQISPRYDIYDAVLRKLWSKMAEKDWRTTLKALYILHRFSADGAPEHAPALKARLRELRRTRDPKRKDKYFNSKQLLAGDTSPETIKFRAFMSRYAHYVILRAQCFGGMFDEIAVMPKPVDAKKKKGSASAAAAPKPITSTCLRTEHLEAAAMLLKAGVACQLKDGEECENTCIALERVVADLIGLTSAVAIALNRALKNTDDLKGADPAIIKKWCEFYKQSLLPQTKMMIKKTSSKLDAYGLFLPSRMGTSVSPEMLQKGFELQVAIEIVQDVKEGEEGETAVAVAEKEKAALPKDVKGDDKAKSNKDDDDDEKEEEEEDDEPSTTTTTRRSAKGETTKQTPSSQPRETRKPEEASYKEEAATAADDEYEYEEEEYYDDDEDE